MEAKNEREKRVVAIIVEMYGILQETIEKEKPEGEDVYGTFGRLKGGEFGRVEMEYDDIYDTQ